MNVEMHALLMMGGGGVVVVDGGGCHCFGHNSYCVVVGGVSSSLLSCVVAGVSSGCRD